MWITSLCLVVSNPVPCFFRDEAVIHKPFQRRPDMPESEVVILVHVLQDLLGVGIRTEFLDSVQN